MEQISSLSDKRNESRRMEYYYGKLCYFCSFPLSWLPFVLLFLPLPFLSVLALIFTTIVSTTIVLPPWSLRKGPLHNHFNHYQCCFFYLSIVFTIINNTTVASTPIIPFLQFPPLLFLPPLFLQSSWIPLPFLPLSSLQIPFPPLSFLPSQFQPLPFLPLHQIEEFGSLKEFKMTLCGFHSE